MNRDMDLVRAILLAMEQQELGLIAYPLRVEGFEEEVIGYHIHLMIQADLITGSDMKTDGHTPTATAKSLTWQGHDFLDTARNETVWKNAKEKLTAVGGTVAFSLLTKVLLKLAGEKIGLKS